MVQPSIAFFVVRPDGTCSNLECKNYFEADWQEVANSIAPSSAVSEFVSNFFFQTLTRMGLVIRGLGYVWRSPLKTTDKQW